MISKQVNSVLSADPAAPCNATTISNAIPEPSMLFLKGQFHPLSKRIDLVEQQDEQALKSTKRLRKMTSAVK